MENRKKIALLIDYDNFSKKEYFPILFDELNEKGDVLIKYAFYSNFSDSTLKDKFITLGIEPKSQLSYSQGKNAVDISIALEAMELLQMPYIDCFCLATNDSDFTPLVLKLKKYNKFIIGAGDEKASVKFKDACNEFVSVEKIYNSRVIEKQKTITPKETKDSKEILELVKIVNDIIDSDHDADDYAYFSVVMQKIIDKIKDFNPKNYGVDNKQPLPFFKNRLKKYFTIKMEKTAAYIKKANNEIV
ncbi:MAG: NYN domain-containing protein [Acholeplasmatales bacterium]|jgi:uncharacterized protein (TIGR00288 family)|nr:NYN domain-containing protein [Acholeplasmatales bacterium]